MCHFLGAVGGATIEMCREHTVGPIVETMTGPVRGRIWRSGFAFLGVPYAEPPFGELRFQAPVPRATWQGLRTCVAYGPTPQRKTLAEITDIPEPCISGEDVLAVNVFTPRPGASRLPVLVYVHGGAYVAGSPASPWYNGAAFTRDGVVVVTVAYRLGFEGFGYLPDTPANRGLLDQILALRWVRDNIAAFGGDPDNVTIAGQSAGGGAVVHLLVSPHARGLFSGVVASSPFLGDLTVVAATAVTQLLAEQLGVTPDLAGFSKVDEMDLIAAQAIATGFGTPQTVDDLLTMITMLVTGTQLGPTLDGDVLPHPMAQALAEGMGADVPLLVGTTRDEFAGIALAQRTLLDNADPVALLVRTGLDPSTAAHYVGVLPPQHPADMLGRLLTDRAFRRYIPDWAEARAHAAAPTFAYDFAWRSPVNGLSKHCLDVPFAWDLLADEHVARVAGHAPPQVLADTVHNAYVAFTRDKDPGWPRWDTDGPVMTWDTESGLTDASAYFAARLLR